MMITPNEEEKYLSFIKVYCQRYSTSHPRAALTNPDTINGHLNKLLPDYAEVNQEAIKRYLQSKSRNKTDYNDIYRTTYWWYIIRHVILLRDGFGCAHKDCDGTCDKLVVHHKNIPNTYKGDYTHLGEELKHLDCLITLCDKCHAKVHNLPYKPKKKRRWSWGKKRIDEIEFEEIEFIEPEEIEDPKLLQQFNENMEGRVFQNTTIDTDFKKHIIIIKTQTPTTEELQEAILHNLDVWLDALNKM